MKWPALSAGERPGECSRSQEKKAFQGIDITSGISVLVIKSTLGDFLWQSENVICIH